MAKEFKRKFMHPTRRKLADMVKTGKYEKNQSVGWEVEEKLIERLVMFGKMNITDMKRKMDIL